MYSLFIRERRNLMGKATSPDHLLKVLKASGLPFDQAIIYCRRQFLHLSYREGQNRGMVIYK